jgi:outer membrane protein TolC
MSCAPVAAAVAAALLAVAPGAAAAAPAPPDSLRLALEEAVGRALARGEEMRSARAYVSQTAGLVRQEMSRALPQITGSLTYDRKLNSIFEGATSDTSVLGDILANSPFAAENSWTAELYGEQLLFSGGKVRAALGAAKAANRSARAAEQETAGDVTFEVTRAYYNAAYTLRLVEIARGSLESAREHLRQVEAGRREGSKSEFDALRAEVDAANQEPALIEAGRGVDLTMLALKRLINVPLDQPLVLVTPLAFAGDLVPAVLEDTLSVAQRPALAAAAAEVEARAQAVKVYRGQHWPDLYLSSTFQEQAFPGEVVPRWDDFRRNWNVAVRLSLPIFTGLRIEGQVQQAQAALATAQAGRDRTRELVAIEADEARSELDRSLSTLLARRTTVRQAKRAFELANVRYTNGMSTQVEVTDARLQYRTAEVNEVSATRDYLVSFARLERAIGHPVPAVRMPLEEATKALDLEGTR